MAGPASAEVPLFAAKCGSGITADSNSKGQVYVSGKVAKLTRSSGGQITARSAGVYVDITPQGEQPPKITATAKGKFLGECEIVSFQAPGSASSAKSTGGAKRAPASERAGKGQFDANGPVSCAMRAGQPMQDCQAAVARDPGGTATIVVTRPDGRKRFIFFEKGKATGADLSQADGSMHFRATKDAKGIYQIEAGNERYEIVDSFVFGG
jgi:hypothetical protein